MRALASTRGAGAGATANGVGVWVCVLQFTDGQLKSHGFKSFGLRKVDELVG